MRYDKEIINRLGMSISNPYFIEDSVKEQLTSDYYSCYFACNNDTEVQFWLDDATLDELYYTDKKWEDIDLKEKCNITVRDFTQEPTEITKYTTNEQGTALEQYLEDYPDTKAVSLEDYSWVAFNEHLAKEMLDTKLHCYGVIRQANDKAIQQMQASDDYQKPFDPAAYCDIIDSLKTMHDKARAFGIDTHSTPLAHDEIDITYKRLEAGLFPDNMDLDMYSDMYKDKYNIRPHGYMPASYISDEEEQARLAAVEAYRETQTQQQAATPKKNISLINQNFVNSQEYEQSLQA